ncbi:MAG: host attachment family protein [Pseudomonadota bacterium]|nr:host attachment family protein [Pseudomonadota bacterium]
MTAAHRAGPIWVATFDGRVGRIYELGQDGNLHHLQAEGMDARTNAQSEPDNLRLTPAFEPGMTEPDFVRKFVGHLDAQAQRGAFDRLIVSADPDALASFRDYAPSTLKAKVSAELNKNHVHTPVKQLESSLAEHLR